MIHSKFIINILSEKGYLVMPKITGRGGFNLFMNDVKDRINNDLKNNLEKGEKLRVSALKTEISKRWNNLPDCSKTIWNDKAK